MLVSCNCYTILPVGATGATGPAGAAGPAGVAGANGDSSYVYIAYATSNTGSGFTENPAALTSAYTHIAILVTNAPIAVRVVGDFAGLWVRYKYGINTYTVSLPASLPLVGLNTGDMCFVLQSRTWYRYDGASWLKVGVTAWTQVTLPPVTLLGGGVSVINPADITFKFRLEGDILHYTCNILNCVFDGVTTGFYVDVSAVLAALAPPLLSALNIGYYQDVANATTYPVTFGFLAGVSRLYVYFSPPGPVVFPATAQGAFSFSGFFEVTV
jgi:hypothetical protein